MNDATLPWILGKAVIGIALVLAGHAAIAGVPPLEIVLLTAGLGLFALAAHQEHNALKRRPENILGIEGGL